jgi:hypothetical protein
MEELISGAMFDTVCVRCECEGFRKIILWTRHDERGQTSFEIHYHTCPATTVQ